MQRKKTNKKSSGKGRSRTIIKWLWLITMAPLSLLALMLILAASGAFGRMPSFEELENPKSNLATEIYADNGQVLGSFFVQNRSYVQYEELFPQDSTAWITIANRQVPPLAAALIATEDARYYTHSGIDLVSLARVGIKTIALQRRSQGGGSTITQQLAKNLFPRGERGENKIVRISARKELFIGCSVRKHRDLLIALCKKLIKSFYVEVVGMRVSDENHIRGYVKEALIDRNFSLAQRTGKMGINKNSKLVTFKKQARMC